MRGVAVPVAAPMRHNVCPSPFLSQRRTCCNDAAPPPNPKEGKEVKVGGDGVESGRVRRVPCHAGGPYRPLADASDSSPAGFNFAQSGCDVSQLIKSFFFRRWFPMSPPWKR